MAPRTMNAFEVYVGSDAVATRRLYAELEACGPLGIIATNLFRACKASERAKKYRGGTGGQSYRQMAYERKAWSMGKLCEVLGEYGNDLGIKWGWKQDPRVLFGQDISWVLYVEAPSGQISFHSPERGAGPDFDGEWDGHPQVGAKRAIYLASTVLESRQMAPTLF